MIIEYAVALNSKMRFSAVKPILNILIKNATKTIKRFSFYGVNVSYICENIDTNHGGNYYYCWFFRFW